MLTLKGLIDWNQLLLNTPMSYRLPENATNIAHPSLSMPEKRILVQVEC
jgi:hypothetical protein